MRLPTTIILLAVSVVAILAPNSAHSGDRLLFPEDFPGLPAYLEVPSSDLHFTDGQWACIPVYRDLWGIPGDFNLLDYLDNATPERLAYAQSVPLHVQGFVVRQFSPPSPPRSLFMEECSGMPILFVCWNQLLDEIADGELYIGELLAMSSLRVGVADMYMEEMQILAGGAPVSSHRRVTFGELLDGTPFQATYSHGSAYDVPKVQVHIRFGE